MMKRRLHILPLIGCLLMCINATAQVTANFSALPTSGCAPIRVVFEDQSTGNPTSWKWDLGNGTIAMVKSPSTTYFTPGLYTVKLTVYRGSDSSTITKTNFISALAGPLVNFDANPKIGCFPLHVSFTDLSTPGSGSIISWQWDFGDGNISNLQNPTHTYLNAGMFNITLTIKNSNGCVNTLYKQNLINVSNGVVAGFSSSSPPTCVVPVTVNFTNTSTGVVNSYLWNFGDGQTSNQASPSHLYIIPGIYTVSLTVTNAAGCSNTISKANLVTIGAVTANFNAPANVCAATDFSLQNSSAPLASLTSSTWDFGDGTTSTDTNPIKSYSTPGVYSVKLVSDFGLCKDSITKTITVHPKPTAGFSGTNLVACQAPQIVSFTNNSAGGTAFSWNFGDGTTSTVANPTHTYTATGSFNVTLIIQNIAGCYDTLIRQNYVVIAPLHINAIAPLPIQGCVPQNISFTPSIVSPDSTMTYEWDFGDGTISTLPNPSHNYTVPGVYAVKLKVRTASGCSDSISYMPGVMVGQKPQPAFSATPRIACPMDLVHFTDSSITPPIPDRWLWIFGDGGTSTQQNPTHNYSDTGYFNVTLITWVNGCSDTVRVPRYIYIKPPVAVFLDSFVCSNQKEHFFKDKSIGAVSYNWTFGDGTSDTVTHSPTHVYADTGRYLVKLWVSNGTCQHVASLKVLVLNEKAGFTTSDFLRCNSTTKVFSATSNPYNLKNFTWNFGDNTLGTGTSNPVIQHRYDSAGFYNIKLKITDLNNCPDSLVTPIIVTKYGPKANFGPFQKLCIGSLTTFADSSTRDTANAIEQWIWDFGDNTGPQTFTAQPFTHLYSAGGLYSVRLIVVDASGCSDTLYKPNNVMINDPKADFNSADTLICRGAPVTLTDISQGNIVSRFWDLGDGSTSVSSNISHPYAAEGLYDIKLWVADDAGCKDSITKSQYIKVYDAKAIFSMNDSLTSCPPLFESFTNQSINAYISNWNFGDNNTSTLANPSHTYTQSGTFYAKLTVTGNGGCMDSASKKITILGPTGSFSYTPVLGCVPLLVNFNSTSQNTSSYTFDFSDGVTQFGNSTATSHPYTSPGDYIPKIILEDSMGCKLPIFGVDTIHVKGVSALIKSLPTYIVCDSGTIQFQDSTITNDQIQSHLWNFGDGTTSVQQNPSHRYSVSGLYPVTLRVITATGCMSMDTLNVPIKVTPSPVIDILGDASGCVPKIVQFAGHWQNPDTSTIAWQWDFQNGQTANQQNPSAVTFTASGQYQVQLIARNASGCADTFFHPLTVFALPPINAGPDKFICRGQTDTLTASGGLTYTWDPHPSLSCTNCSQPFVHPDSTQQYLVHGTDTNSCKNTDSVLIKVKQRFVINVASGDTLCVGQLFQLKASGAEKYLWEPPLFLNKNDIPNPVSKPDTSITYRVTGYDSLGCFRDTGFVRIKVYPIPNVNIIEDQITQQVGDPFQLHSTASPDVIRWRWNPSIDLTCTACPNPIASAKQNISYVLTVTNAGNCTAQDRVTITMICKEGNMYVPNTFSPNNDGANDVFYPRGKGVFSIKSMRVFNRWGELVFEKTNFDANDPTAGWDGKYKGVLLTPDVYVYMIDVVCESNFIYTVKGDVTLLR